MPPAATAGKARAAATLATAPIRVKLLMRSLLSQPGSLGLPLSAVSLSAVFLAAVSAENTPSPCSGRVLRSAQMDFRILGPLEAWDGDRQLDLGGAKRRAVLALLVLHANEVVGSDRLIDQLWGEKAPRNAAAALHTHVSRLRKELGVEVVVTRAWGYVLRTEAGAIDLERFERDVADGENLPARERAEKLRDAL